MRSHQGCQVQFRTSRRNVGILWRCSSGQGPHIAMTRETRGFSRVAAGFSSYDGEFRLPLVLAQEVQSSIQLVRESWGLLSSHFRAKSPHLGLGPGRNVPLQGRQGYRGRIPVSFFFILFASPGKPSMFSPTGKLLLTFRNLIPSHLAGSKYFLLGVSLPHLHSGICEILLNLQVSLHRI